MGDVQDKAMEDGAGAPPVLGRSLGPIHIHRGEEDDDEDDDEEDEEDDQDLEKRAVLCVCCKAALDEVLYSIKDPEPEKYTHYCQSCWENLPLQVVTVLVDEEQQVVSCVGMDGSKLAEATHWDVHTGTIGDLRRRVLDKSRGFTNCEEVNCNDHPPYVRCRASEVAIVSLALPDGRILAKGENSSPLSKLFHSASIFAGDMVTYHGKDQRLAGKTLCAGAKGEVISTEDGRCLVRFPGLSSCSCNVSNLVYCGKQSFDCDSLRQQPMLLPRPCAQTLLYSSVQNERSSLSNLNLEPARISCRAHHCSFHCRR
eukprot:TRINITY_DN4476_c0_g2_i1.p1 TRINITY_DN4476_c0_g2~~TRINITY_DN4476_c0_g2_i1.p1  ORF type:complete len:330 (+),score=56.09 TRINITY_DN4476_c0_g2_i1:53-991(+)